MRHFGGMVASKIAGDTGKMLHVMPSPTLDLIAADCLNLSLEQGRAIGEL